MRCDGCDVVVPAADVRVDALARVEGASDPGDEAVVVAIRCPGCDEGAVLVLAYGPNAGADDAEVLLALPDAPEPGEDGAGRTS